MLINVSDVYNIVTGGVINEIDSLKGVDSTTSLSIIKFIDSINTEYSQSEKVRVKFVKEFGTKIDETENFNIEGDNKLLFEEKMKELLEQEIEIDDFSIKIEYLKDLSIKTKRILFKFIEKE